MAYDENLEKRIVRILDDKNITFESKRMIGGLCFMVDEKMVVGIMKDSILARVDPDLYSKLIKRKDCGPMKLGGKVMEGYVYVASRAVTSDEKLSEWIELCLEFNPRAKASKKKK